MSQRVSGLAGFHCTHNSPKYDIHGRESPPLEGSAHQLDCIGKTVADRRKREGEAVYYNNRASTEKC